MGTGFKMYPASSRSRCPGEGTAFRLVTAPVRVPALT